MRAGRAWRQEDGAARRATVAHEAAESCRPSSRPRCALAAQLRCAGRTIGTRWTAAGREGLHACWRYGETMLRGGRPECCAAAGRRCMPLVDDGAHWLRKLHAVQARCCVRRRALPPRFYGGGAAGRPALRQSSGDVVTAKLF
ncbi:hypothetical protein F511_46661 [Dorcoceras hygrometricum]|uniref:Uncharacterized protein n=1 Tax=Dorcoceras hygrometricum TaxID=472368 RepID=A0A2Z6ZSZ9_9LAMI|nr:hypothetical protein F511_46661 [Dorcoceras hygrometricum]